MDKRKCFIRGSAVAVFFYCYLSIWLNFQKVNESEPSHGSLTKLLKKIDKDENSAIGHGYGIYNTSIAIINKQAVSLREKIALRDIENLQNSQKLYKTARILLWTHIYLFSKTMDEFSVANCYPYQCNFTKNREYTNASAAVMFDNSRLKNETGPHKLRNQSWIFMSGEAVPNHNVSDVLDETINLKFTYHTDSDISWFFGHYIPYGEYSYLPYYIPPRNTPEGEEILKALEEDTNDQYSMYKDMIEGHTKDKHTLWMISHCGVKLRDNYGEDLAEAGIPIDKFGRCGKPDPCKRNATCVKNMTRSYKFYLAFENSLCKDYITEKTWLALHRGMVPITLGTKIRNYEKLLPPNSFIHVDNFTSVEALAQYLKYLDENDDAYMRYHEWRKKYQIVYWEHHKPMLQCDVCWHAFRPVKPTYKSIKQWYKC